MAFWWNNWSLRGRKWYHCDRFCNKAPVHYKQRMTQSVPSQVWYPREVCTPNGMSAAGFFSSVTPSPGGRGCQAAVPPPLEINFWLCRIFFDPYFEVPRTPPRSARSPIWWVSAKSLQGSKRSLASWREWVLCPKENWSTGEVSSFSLAAATIFRVGGGGWVFDDSARNIVSVDFIKGLSPARALPHRQRRVFIRGSMQVRPRRGGAFHPGLGRCSGPRRIKLGHTPMFTTAAPFCFFIESAQTLSLSSCIFEGILKINVFSFCQQKQILTILFWEIFKLAWMFILHSISHVRGIIPGLFWGS